MVPQDKTTGLNLSILRYIGRIKSDQIYIFNSI